MSHLIASSSPSNAQQFDTNIHNVKCQLAQISTTNSTASDVVNTISMVCVLNPVEIFPAVKLGTTRYRPIQPQPKPQPTDQTSKNYDGNCNVQTKSIVETNSRVPGALSADLNIDHITQIYSNTSKNVVITNQSETQEQSVCVEQLQIAGYYCNICNCFYHSVTHCPAHTEPETIILDSVIPSKARLTLPKQLFLQSSGVAHNSLGVWTRTSIVKRTQFGPLIGKIIPKEEVIGIDLSDKSHLWQVYQENKLIHGLMTSNEDECNWMMFVQRARSSTEQNLVAFLLDSKIFFMTTRSISADTELLMWFSTDFCQLLGLPLKPEDGFTCTECQKKFVTTNSLERHKRYLHASIEGRKWQCSTCCKYFPSATKLSVHTLGHMGIKPHACSYCNKQFTDASNLRGHLSIHTGERRFSCTMCSKSFRQKAHLTSHLLTHSGEKKLKCHFCERWFARSSDLRQHEYSHTHERQFPCTICNKVFYRLQTQKKHLKVHAGQRDFECIKCNKRFFTKYHMERHRKVCRGRDVRSSKIKTTTKSSEIT